MGTAPETVTRSFALPAKLADKLDRIAEAEDISADDLLVEALTLHFDALVEIDPGQMVALRAEIAENPHAVAVSR